MGVRYCTNCGNMIPDGFNVCNACGRVVNVGRSSNAGERNMDQNVNAGQQKTEFHQSTGAANGNYREQYFREMYENERRQAEYLRQQNERMMKMQKEQAELQNKLYEMKQRKKIVVNPFSLLAAFIVMFALRVPFFSTSDGYSEMVTGGGTFFKWLDIIGLKNSFDSESAADQGSMKSFLVLTISLYLIVLFVDAFRKISTAKVIMSVIFAGIILVFSSGLAKEIEDSFGIDCSPGAGEFLMIIATIMAVAGCAYDATKRQEK